MKRLYCILLCVLPLLVASCNRDEGVNGNYESTVFEPGYLEFGPEGGTAEITVNGDFGVCTVTATSPRNITVTVPPNSEYREINFSAVAYEGRADKFMAPGVFTIWKVDDGE